MDVSWLVGRIVGFTALVGGVVERLVASGAKMVGVSVRGKATGVEGWVSTVGLEIRIESTVGVDVDCGVGGNSTLAVTVMMALGRGVAAGSEL
jgi:hypothetical protein